MFISCEGINLIKQFEGLKLQTYICPAGINTIGYGTTKINSKPVPSNLTITEEEADEFLREDVKKFEQEVNSLVEVCLKQNQFDALVSFCYNLGGYNLKVSTLLKKINKNPNDESIEDEFKKWVYAGGKKLKGLERRRKAEAELYFK